ncbi:ribosome biogenesis GTP-binding protein YihA/YsxC [Mycoplasmatota bacterium]|nr:ribosome biogenesis GTP-binding protein YihA/YsxC [Mycoplasmatota bacterium]
MLITKAELVAMGTNESHFPQDGLKEIVLAGRSNVGKSSFINSMVQRNKLAYTSSNPGKTQTLNFYNINDRMYFVDVPGYGYARVSKHQREAFGQMIESYLKTRKELMLAILLIDFRHKPTEDDILMYEFLKYYHIKTLVVATKCDKIGKTHYMRHEKMIKQAINFSKDDYFIRYSSHTNSGREDTWKLIMNTLIESEQ